VCRPFWEFFHTVEVFLEMGYTPYTHVDISTGQWNRRFAPDASDTARGVPKTSSANRRPRVSSRVPQPAVPSR
jgi:hypothetical protein